ncbi:hypothetical protein GCM10027270_35450 [Nocardioides ginkgobilobae]
MALTRALVPLHDGRGETLRIMTGTVAQLGSTESGESLSCGLLSQLAPPQRHADMAGVDFREVDTEIIGSHSH